MDSKIIEFPRRKKRIVFIPAIGGSRFVPAVYEISLPVSGTVLEVKRNLGEMAGILHKNDNNDVPIDIESKTLMFSVCNHCIHRVFQNDSKSNVLEDVQGLLYLCEVKSNKNYVDIELTNRIPHFEPFGHPTVIPIPRPQLSSLSLTDLRQIIKDGIAPFLKGGWAEDEEDRDLYSIVIMDEAASTVRHVIQYDCQVVNLKQFVGKRGGFSVSLLWTSQSRQRYIDNFTTFLSPPKPILLSGSDKPPTSGYPETIFSDQEAVRDFICPICMDIVRNAMETKCGHLFCELCLSKVLEAKTPQLCPMKCGIITTDTVQPLGTFTKRKIMNFPVKCDSNPDCNWHGVLLGYEEHIAKCSFTMVECSGCLEQMRRHEFDDHLFTECDYRIEQCSFCDTKQLYKDLNKHQSEECVRAPRCCMYEGCEFVGTSDELDKHFTHCQHQPKGCPFQKFGCGMLMKDSQLSAHCEEATAKHLELVMSGVEVLTTQVKELSEQVRVLTSRLDQ